MIFGFASCPLRTALDQGASFNDGDKQVSVVVLKGSEINENTSGKSLSKGMKAIREKHIASELVNEEHITTEDILFSSSSAAADFVTGYSVSGPAVWKNIKGKSLREIESE